MEEVTLVEAAREALCQSHFDEKLNAHNLPANATQEDIHPALASQCQFGECEKQAERLVRFNVPAPSVEAEEVPAVVNEAQAAEAKKPGRPKKQVLNTAAADALEAVQPPVVQDENGEDLQPEPIESERAGG